MDLQISVFLLLALFKTGQSLDCYKCFSVTGSCEDQTVQTCPELYSCFSSTVVTQLGNSNTTTAKYKGCSPYGCLTGLKNFMSTDVSFVCCDTDLCNAKDTQAPSVEPNGNTCYSCYGQDCSKIIACSGSEDHCITVTGNFGGQSITSKGCVSKAACDAVSSYPNGQSISCCSGNLCNSAKSFTLSLLFLCCSLISFIMML